MPTQPSFESTLTQPRFEREAGRLYEPLIGGPRQEPGTRIVCVVDDEGLMRQSLAITLESRGYEVRTFASGAEFLASGDAHEAACLILDLKMPNMSGMEVIERLGDSPLLKRTVIVSGQGDIDTAVAAVKHGVVDFIEKPFTTERLLARVQEAMDVRDRMDRDALRWAQTNGRLDALTNREVTVLRYVIAGEASKVIARTLGCTQKTVETHRSRILLKLGARNVAELVRLVLSPYMADGCPFVAGPPGGEA